MRLIGIQALLGLLQQRISAKAEAHGTGVGIFPTVAISNAGVVGSALGNGSISGVGVTVGAISGIGSASAISVANGGGAGTGLFIGVGAAAGHGTSVAAGANNVISGTGLAIGSGVAIGKPASAGAASGIGSANVVGFAAGAVSSIGSAAGVGASNFASPSPAGDFLARTSGLDSTHITAYTNLINGLVTDGVWGKLDVLYIFATQDATTAKLNLVSSNFTAIANGSPAFVADRGFTGVDSSGTVYLETQFNPITATSPQFVTNSCHLSAWADTNLTSTSSGGALIGADLSGAGNRSNIFARFSDGNAYFRINDGGSSGGFANASAIGHYIASRTGASASVGYKNGAVLGSPNAASGTLQNKTIIVLALRGPSTGTPCQVTEASIGGGLTATDATNFYNRLRTYMTAVGVP